MNLYTRADIRDNFETRDFNRGLEYYKAGKVVATKLLKNGTAIIGEVSGSRKYNYDQEIHFDHDDGSAIIEGECSCPVGFNCKHVAAVLFKVLDTPGSKLTAHEGNSGKTVGISPQVNDWLQKIEVSLENNGDPNSYPDKLKNRLIFLLHPGRADAYGITKHPHITFMNVRLIKSGGYGSSPHTYNPENIFNYKVAAFLRPVDLEILREFHVLKEAGVYWGDNNASPLPATSQGVPLLRKILSTGRCRFESLEGPVLSEGPTRKASLDWQMDASGRQKIVITCNQDVNESEVLPLSPPFYIDRKAGTCGPLDLGIPADFASLITSAPAVNAVEAAKITEALTKYTKKRKIKQNIPLPKTAVKALTKKVKPTPCLELFQAEIKYNRNVFAGYGGQYSYYYHASYVPATFPLARLTFEYNGISLSLDDTMDSIEHIEEDTLISIPRDRHAEKNALNLLKKRGFRQTKDLSFLSTPQKHASDFYLMPDDFERLDFRAIRVEEFFDSQRFINFSALDIPELEANGWRIRIADDYPYILAQGSIDWWADVKEKSGIDWFSFSLGIEFEGERINLLPTLLKMISMLPSVLVDIEEPEKWDDLITAMFENQTVYHRLEDGRLLPLPGDRVIPIVMSLLELIGPMSLLDMTDEGEIRLNPRDAGGLAAFEEGSRTAQLAWKGQRRLLDLGNRLRNSMELPRVRLPKHLANILRPYQKHGVNWLSFLRETGFGAVLADDMGLGKTLQVLCFIQTEIRRRRLNKPILVVSPTSVLPNWKAEVEKFAPSLRVLTLHGSDRSARFAKIPEYDLILTTYPLLTRDKDVLLKHEYQIVILDEAQVIKNAKANVSLIACALKSDCRIALTGTPVENNLDELWSLFRFVNPGLLGDQTSFRQNFRTPIEKQGNTNIQSYLSRRVKPFMLRRTKEQVALELPPKTEVIEHIELEAGQRDLYETIRLVMDKKVREAISLKGLHRSQIIVLDALLKLRQVCCDPRLLKLDSAKKVKHSAKLNRLMEIIPEMLAEGRRILLFSQFTSMLSLIEKELFGKKIDFVKITGTTKDRETPVKEFQSGNVPLFLISLKAGGTGLNLTAADTVIHYDPWWNPAVENQATDRAHRIGQDKPVFVHKLIVSNGVEEAIQELKKKKAALAEALFSENTSERFELTEDDLTALFAPLEKAA